MEQLVNAFGIELELIIAQIVNFGILAAALSYFLYKPLLNMLQKREQTIAQGVQDAEDAAKAKAEADAQKKQILADAHKEAEAVADKAKTFAEEKAATLTAQAQQKAESIVKDAEVKSAQLKEQAIKESESDIAKLAVLAAEKILKSNQNQT